MANIGSREIRGDVFARGPSRGGGKISTCFESPTPFELATSEHLGVGQDEGILNRDRGREGQVRSNSFEFPCLSFRAGVTGVFEDCQSTCPCY